MDCDQDLDFVCIQMLWKMTSSEVVEFDLPTPLKQFRYIFWQLQLIIQLVNCYLVRLEREMRGVLFITEVALVRLCTEVSADVVVEVLNFQETFRAKVAAVFANLI